MSVTEAFNYEIKELSVAGISLSDNTDKYIYIENLYSARTIANMYLALHVPQQTYLDIVAAEGDKEKGYVNLVLGVRNALSNTATSTNVVEGRFSYIVSNDNLNKTAFFTDINNYSEDMTYKSIYLSIIWEDTLDNMKTSISGTYYMISVHEVIKLILSGFKNIIVQTPNVNFSKMNADSIGTSVNKSDATGKLEDKDKRGQYVSPKEKEIPGDVFEQLVLPPITNRKKLLEYVFNLKPFYKTAYTFFCDFHNTYLIAHDVESTTVGEIDTIIFHITDILDDYAYIEGMATPVKSKKQKKKGKNKGSYIEGSTYHIYVNPANVNISPAKGMDKISTTFMSVTESGMVSEPLQLTGSMASGDNTKLAIHQGNYPELYVNILNSSSIYIEFTKAYINSSVITPDKNIIIEFSDKDQKKYEGNYYMAYKTEIIRNNSGNFMCSAAFGMYKIGEIKDFSVGNESSDFKNQETSGGTTKNNKVNVNKTQVKSGSRGAGSSKNTTSAPRLSAPAINRSQYATTTASKGFQGPPLIDRRSSGPTVFNEPHTYEPGIKK